MSDRRAELALIFDRIGDALDVLGENYHRIWAYRRAAENLRVLGEPLETVWADGRLEQIPGVGGILANKIDEYLRTGRLEAYEKLLDRVPLGVLEILQVPEVGPRKAALFWHELGICSIEDLESAARYGQLRSLKGIGPRLESRILEGIVALQRQRQGRLPLGVVWPLAHEILQVLMEVPETLRASTVGSLRRMRETIGDLGLLVAANDPLPVMERFRTLSIAAEVVTAGAARTTIRTPDGVQVELRVFPPERWGSVLQYFTGSQAHNIRLRNLALEKGLALSEYGFRRQDGSELFCADEAEVYATLGLPWIPPELRESRGEIEAALAGQLPKLVEPGEILGDFQCHTTRSDGHASMEEMVRAARDAGLHYMVVSDHTSGMGIGEGVAPEAVDGLLAEVAYLNSRQPDGFRILAGAEVEIHPDGRLDWPDEALARLDFVIAAVHAGLNETREEATARILGALKNPYVDLIAHPTGRLLGRRESADLDMEMLLRTAAERGVAVEINAHPNRLDFNGFHVRQAVQYGVTLAISSDAHDGDGFAALPFGVAMARRGWAGADQLLNTRPVEEVLAWRRRRMSRH